MSVCKALETSQTLSAKHVRLRFPGLHLVQLSHLVEAVVSMEEIHMAALLVMIHVHQDLNVANSSVNEELGLLVVVP